MKGGIRSEEADEVAGIDLPEMGVLAYPEFHPAEVSVAGNGETPATEEEPAPV